MQINADVKLNMQRLIAHRIERVAHQTICVSLSSPDQSSEHKDEDQHNRDGGDSAPETHGM